MNTPPPIPFTWDGEAMIPKIPRLADRYYVVGEQYRLVPEEQRSRKTHDHFFASVHEAFLNLPEHLAEQYPTEDKLRKHCLIKAGYADETTFVCGSKAEAVRLQAFLRPIDECAIIVAREGTVRRYVAQSQSKRAMGAKVFQESKQKVLDILAEMIGVTPEALAANTQRAA